MKPASAPAPAPSAPDVDINAPLKARYLYNFAKYVDWPADKKQGNFVIGVMGESSLYDEMAKLYANKKVGSQTLVIKKLASVEEASGCNILFVPTKQQSKVGTIAQKSRSNSILIVTEKSGSLNQGAVINFFVQNSRIAFELSKRNAEKYKLTLGQDIVKFAAKVQ